MSPYPVGRKPWQKSRRLKSCFESLWWAWVIWLSKFIEWQIVQTQKGGRFPRNRYDIIWHNIISIAGETTPFFAFGQFGLDSNDQKSLRFAFNHHTLWLTIAVRMKDFASISIPFPVIRDKIGFLAQIHSISGNFALNGNIPFPLSVLSKRKKGSIPADWIWFCFISFPREWTPFLRLAIQNSV